MREKQGILRIWQLFLQPNTEYMWLTREDWQSLVPADPAKGQKLEIDSAIVERMARFHLTPQRAMTSEGGIVSKRSVKSARLSLVVEDVSRQRIRMQLEGFVHWGSDFDKSKATTPNGPRRFTAVWSTTARSRPLHGLTLWRLATFGAAGETPTGRACTSNALAGRLSASPLNWRRALRRPIESRLAETVVTSGTRPATFPLQNSIAIVYKRIRGECRMMAASNAGRSTPRTTVLWRRRILSDARPSCPPC